MTVKQARILCLVTWAIVLMVIVLGSVTPAHAYSQKHNRWAIRYEAKKAGYGKVQTRALLTLSFRESRWHNRSHSRTSECHGLFQLSKGMAHGHPWRKPRWNTRRAIRYIKHRYGTPTRALAHSYRYGWY